MSLNDLTHIKIDGMDFFYLWLDIGSNMQLDVYQNDQFLGSKKMPITVDQGEGVVIHTVRSFLREQYSAKDSKVQ